MFRPTKALAALGLATTLAIGLPAVAQAEVLVHQDARHDVVRTTWGQYPPTTKPAPNVRFDDIQTVRVDYRRHVLKLTLTANRLDRYAMQFVDLDLMSGNPRAGGTSFSAGLFITPFDPQGSQMSYGSTPGGCDGMRHSVNYARGTVRFSVPARCFGHPPTVRVGVDLGRFLSKTANFYDSGWGAHGAVMRYSRPIHRG